MHSNVHIGILTFVPDLWEHYWMARHHIMYGLSRYYKVLWVAPPLHWRVAIQGRAGGVKRISPSFWIYYPERYLPFSYRSGFFDMFLDKLRMLRIKSLLHAMNINQLILYIWRPNFAHYIGRFNEELVCYHIDDEYTFSDTELSINSKESELIKRSDIVFIHSKTLLEKKGHINPETHYIPNGVDFERYHQIAGDNKCYASEFSHIPKPRIGYIGYIKKQIDIRLLLEISRKRKDWSIVIVGPINLFHKEIQEDIKALQSENNVYFLGAKKPDDLPKYIKEIDVCLMNYNKTAYTDYIYPMKLHEYLSCGKPVVATCLKNLREFRDLLYFAEGVEDWIDKIQQALKDSSYDKKLQRISVAKENSWETRVTKISLIFQDRLSRTD